MVNVRKITLGIATVFIVITFEPVSYAQSSDTVFGNLLKMSESSVSTSESSSTLTQPQKVLKENSSYQTSNSLASKIGRAGWLVITFFITISWIIYIIFSRRQ